jgi:hypothetical protein
VQKPAQKSALEKQKPFFHFRTGPATAGCSNRRIMVVVGAESMVGGTVRPFHPQMIQTQMLSRVFVFSFLGEHLRCPGIARDSLFLTDLRFYRGAPSV